MTKSAEFVQRYLKEIEKAADGILLDQQEVVSLDRRRNTNREALRNVQNNPTMKGKRLWIFSGDQFLQLPKEKTITNIQKEQKQIDNEIDAIKNQLRKKVDYLHELEGKEPTRGSNLLPLTNKEKTFISKFQSH